MIKINLLFPLRKQRIKHLACNGFDYTTFWRAYFQVKTELFLHLKESLEH